MSEIMELVIFLILTMALIALSIYVIVAVKFPWGLIGVAVFWLLVGIGYGAYRMYPKGSLTEQFAQNYK